MGTRLYLTAAAATYTPPTIRGSFSDKTLTGASKLIARKTGGFTVAGRAETSTLNTWSVLLRRFVSDPIANAATLDGAVAMCFGVAESDLAADLITQLHMFVTVGSTDVVRGALTPLALGGAAEWPLAGAQGASNGRGQLLTTTLTAVAAQPGDRVVIELGFRVFNTVGTSYSGALVYGATGSDLTDGSPLVTSRPGWIDFAGAGFATAFGPQVRSGQSVTALTLGHTTPTHIRRATGQSVTPIVLTHAQPMHARKAQSVTALTLGHESVDVAHLAAGGESVTDMVLDHRTWGEHLALGPNESTTHLTLVHRSYAQLEGQIATSPPSIDLLPAPAVRRPPPPVRFIAQDIRTRKFRDQDLPLVDPVITYTLSGATVIKANLKAGYRLSDFGLDGWATWIQADQGGELVAEGILLPGAVGDAGYDLTAVGFTAYPQGMTYWGESSLIQADPADVVRLIWQHLQSFPDAQLGVTVDATTKTPVTVGVPAHQDLDEAGKPAYDDTIESAPSDADGTAPTPNDTIVSTSTNADTGVITVTYADGSKLVRRPRVVEETPYVLAWYADTDCGQEISTLCQAGGIEYLEQVAWTPDRSGVVRNLRLGYPRIGRRRTDLRCALGEALIAQFPLDEPPEQYAGEIQTRGMGEGRDAVRGLAGGPHPTRVRRAVTLTDQTIQKPEQAVANSQAEATRRAPAVTIGELHLVADHPQMQRGAYVCGDEVLVVGDDDFAGHIELWHRIESYDWLPDSNLVVAKTRRAEQFAYGRFPTPPVIPPPKIIDDGSSDPDDTDNPTVPARVARTPGELLRIGADNKQNHFIWQIGLAGGSGLTTYKQADIGGGASHDPEFKLVTVGGRQFVQNRVRMDAPTTPNSTNPRSEGREMGRDGTSQAAWSADGGWIYATLAIPEVGPNQKITSGMQIHDENSDVIQILRWGNQLRYRLNGVDNAGYVLLSTYNGEPFTCKIQTNSSSQAVVTINGSSKTLAIKPKGKMYYKVGAYPQRATSEPNNAWTTVLIGGDLAHWHPGWPTPVIETAGGSSGGGVITGTVVACCKNSDSQIYGQLAKIKAKYGFQMGDLYYADGSSNYEQHMADQVGAPNCSRWTKSVQWWGYTPSDHDFAFVNDGTATPARTSGFNSAYRKLMSVVNPKVGPLLTSSNDVRHTWTDGIVRFIATDELSHKDPLGSNGSILGSDQEAWFANLMKNPGKGIKLVVIIGDTPMIGPTLAGDDGWKGYPAARSRYTAAVSRCPVPRVRFSGDMHCVRVSRDRYGLQREYGAAPAHNTTKVKAKSAEIDWSEPTNDTESDTKITEQAGAFVITDKELFFGLVNSKGQATVVDTLRFA